MKENQLLPDVYCLPWSNTDVEEVVKESVRLLPGALEEAVAALEGDKVLHESIGAPLVSAITAVRKSEAAFHKNNSNSKLLLAARY
jgi:glutamine synthetase